MNFSKSILPFKMSSTLLDSSLSCSTTITTAVFCCDSLIFSSRSTSLLCRLWLHYKHCLFHEAASPKGNPKWQECAHSQLESIPPVFHTCFMELTIFHINPPTFMATYVNRVSHDVKVRGNSEQMPVRGNDQKTDAWQHFLHDTQAACLGGDTSTSLLLNSLLLMSSLSPFLLCPCLLALTDPILPF